MSYKQTGTKHHVQTPSAPLWAFDSIPRGHFLNIPTELRQEIFKYLLTNQPIDSLTMYKPEEDVSVSTVNIRGLPRTKFPTSLTNLLLGFDRGTYEEIKDVFYKTATFNIDISRDGATLCGRRILGPLSRDGYILGIDNQAAIDQFIRNFPWSVIKNYAVSISIGRPETVHDVGLDYNMRPSRKVNEVELYDLRDYVAVIVSCVVAKAKQLNNLQVSLVANDLEISPEEAMEIISIVTGPFQRLRRVRNPTLTGFFHRPRPIYASDPTYTIPSTATYRSLPPITPDPHTIFSKGSPYFATFSADWQRRPASEAATTIIPVSPMTKLFDEFTDLYNKLASIMPGVVRRGSQCFLHRARVAREMEDIATFRLAWAELMACWRHRVQMQDVERQEVRKALKRVVDADCYPRAEGK